MRIPDPIANTTTEAYLAYKAGVLAEGDLKPKLYDPYIHLDAWLAYWAGLTNEYPLDKNGDPEMLTDEEAYIAYLSGVTNTYPEEFRDPADIRVAAYLRYLISARFGRPEYPVTNEELYLSMLKTKYIPSGDPSSDIEIDGTAKAPFVDVKMYGDTSQTTYTGKNLYRVESRSQKGVTFTVNADGSLNIVGKATANVIIVDEVKPITLMADNSPYICWWDGDNSLPAGVAIRLGIDKNGNWDHNLMSGMQGRTKSRTFTSSLGDGDAIRCELYVENGTEVNLQNIKIQLEAGSTATSFEPYVGGQASPNPDYPQPIQVVTGEQVVEVQGKNLFDKNHPNNSKCYVNSSGVLTSGSSQNLSVYIKCEPNTTYTVSKSNKGTNNRFCVFNTEAEPAIGVSVIGTVGTRLGEDNSSSYTITTGANAHYLGVFYQVAATTPSESEIKDTIQIEKGSTATAYEPYQEQSYEVNLGKNLFDIAAASDVWINTSGVSQPNAYWKNSDFIKVDPNTTYTLSGSTIEGGYPTKQFQYHEYSSDNESSYINQYRQINDVNSVTFTTHTGCNYVRVGYRMDALKDIQFEKGSTASDYAAYFTPIELCKLGDSQDYIWEDDGEWKIHKAIATHLFDGSTNDGYNFNADQANTLAVNLNPDKIDQIAFKYTSTTVKSCMTASFRYVWDISDVEHIYVTGAQQVSEGYNGNIRLYILKSRLDGYSASLTNAEKAQLVADWLASNPMKVYYIPSGRASTDTVITNQNLIDQLNALKQGGAEEGTTYIKVDATDPNLPGLLYVEAPKYE